MSIQNKDPMTFRRFSLGFMGFINWMGILIWLFMIMRSGEFLQENYYFFNGNMLYTFCILLSIPILGITYRFWDYVHIRQIICGLQLIGLGLMTFLLRDYFEFMAQVPTTGYIFIGTFLQRNIIYVSVLNLCLFTSFMLILQLLIHPNKIGYGEKDNRSTPAVGVFPLVMNSQNTLIASVFGGVFIASFVSLWLITSFGAGWWLLGFYFFLVIGMICVWVTSRKPYQPKESPYPYQMDITFMKNMKILLGFSIVAGIVSVLGLYYINSFNSFKFLGLVLGVFSWMGIGRLILDYRYRPKNQSDSLGHAYTKRIFLDTVLFGGFSIYGGALIFISGWLFVINIDRNSEFDTLMWLILIIGLTFITVLYLVPVISSKLLLMLSTIAILSCLLIQLQIADFAASNASYWENRTNVLEGFAFHQSLENAVLCGIPIGIVFAIYFSYFVRYSHETHQIGVNFEIPLTLFFVFFSAGIVYGHDIKYSGLNVSENLMSAMENYTNLSFIFYAMMAITLLNSFGALYLLYKQILKERKSIYDTK